MSQLNVIQSQRDEFWNRDRRHCYWSGRNSWPICNGFCRSGEFVLTTSDTAPGGNKCLAGQLSYCCRRRNGNNDDFRPNPPQPNFNSIVFPPNWNFPGLRAASAALNAVASEIAPNTQPAPWMRPSASRP